MSKNTHVSSVFVDAPFDAVWAWASDPSRFPLIYPSWISEVKALHAGHEEYEGVGPSGDRFKIIPKLNREHGVVDFEIVDENGNVELSRAPWVFGQHDRGWQERNVFGKVRYMSAGGLKRKAKPEEYVQKVQHLIEEGRAEAL